MWLKIISFDKQNYIRTKPFFGDFFTKLYVFIVLLETTTHDSQIKTSFLDT